MAEGRERSGRALEILRLGNPEARWVVCFRPGGPASTLRVFFSLSIRQILEGNY